MSGEDIRCATCSYWSHTLPPVTTGIRRPDGYDKNIGTCQLCPPLLLVLEGATVSMQPQTHADRGCGAWCGDQSPGGPDGGGEVIDFATRRDAA